MNFQDFTDIVNIIFLLFSSSLFGTYLFTAILSIIEINKYLKRNQSFNYRSMLSFPMLPSVSILAPAYNEEKTIIENIKCLLALQYVDYDIIIINDGSKDTTLSKIIDYFGLIEVNMAYELNIPCAPIRGIYKSTNAAYSNLTVIDKENGGKADALNAGVNISQKELFLAMDVDCILESDAILKMVKPFLDDSEHVVIASGGVIRIANSCDIINGKIVKVNYPKNFWAKFQVLEYFRAFTLGRMAWSKLNGLLIISGAFGLFDRRIVLEVGGYDKTTVGEDLELVVRMRRYMHEIEKKKYKVAFIPDPLCWTEVPESYKVLSRQRNRWTRGAIDTIKKHKGLFMNRKYGIIGLASYPYWVVYEWLTPIIELLGFLYLTFVIIWGGINWQIAIVVFIFVMTFSWVFSSIAIFIEAYTYHKYRGKKYLLKALLFILLEMFTYQPLNMYFALSGNFDYFFKKNKKGWGNMIRKGFVSKEIN